MNAHYTKSICMYVCVCQALWNWRWLPHVWFRSKVVDDTQIYGRIKNVLRKNKNDVIVPFKCSSQTIMTTFSSLHGLRGQMDLTSRFKIGFSNSGEYFS